MIGARFARIRDQLPGDLQAGLRDVGGRRRPAHLVGDDGQPVALCPQPQHGLDEIRAMRRDHPGGAQDRVGPAGGAHALFSRELGAAIGVLRGNRVCFDPRVRAAAREDVIGRDMHQRDAACRAGLRHGRRRVPVDGRSLGLVLLGAVDGGPGGGVDHRAGVMRLYRGGTGRGIRQVGGVAAQAGHRLRLPCQFRGHLAGSAEDENVHGARGPSVLYRAACAYAVTPSRSPTPLRVCSARHQSSLSRYHCTVRRNPSSTVTEGRQPSSARMRPGSMA